MLPHCSPAFLFMKIKIEFISNHIFANRMYFEGFNRPQFIKLLSLPVKNCHFIFNGRIYQQIDRVAMGIRGYAWFCKCPSLFKPLLYRRYVDDCFLLFRSLDHAPLSSSISTANTLTFLLHPNWKKTASFLFSMLK